MDGQKYKWETRQSFPMTNNVDSVDLADLEQDATNLSREIFDLTEKTSTITNLVSDSHDKVMNEKQNVVELAKLAEDLGERMHEGNEFTAEELEEVREQLQEEKRLDSLMEELESRLDSVREKVVEAEEEIEDIRAKDQSLAEASNKFIRKHSS